jgi:hypothetical protein
MKTRCHTFAAAVCGVFLVACGGGDGLPSDGGNPESGSMRDATADGRAGDARTGLMDATVGPTDGGPSPLDGSADAGLTDGGGPSTMRDARLPPDGSRPADATTPPDGSTVDGGMVSDAGTDGGPSPYDDLCDGTRCVTFRFTDLDQRDPHAFGETLLGCTDITDVELFGQKGLNPLLEEFVTTDVTGNGLYEISLLLSFPSFDPAADGGVVDVLPALCQVADDSCTPRPGAVPERVAYVNRSSDSCLGILDGTTSNYDPPIQSTTAPCFVTDELDLVFSLGDVVLPFRNLRIAARYEMTEPATLTQGVMRGFLSEAEAETIVVPPDLGMGIGVNTLAELFPGNPGCCATTELGLDDRDLLNGVAGWWTYYNFPAAEVPFDPDGATGL